MSFLKYHHCFRLPSLLCFLLLSIQCVFAQDSQEPESYVFEDSTELLLMAGKHEECGEMLYRYLAEEETFSNRKRVVLHYNFALYNKVIGNVDRSIEHLNTVQSLLPDEGELHDRFILRCYHNKTILFFDIHEMDSSRVYLNKILEDHEGIPEHLMIYVYNIQAYFEFLDGNYPEAEEIYKRNIEASKKSKIDYCALPLTTVKLMQLYGKTKDEEALNETFKETIALCKECNAADLEVYARYVRSEIARDMDNFELGFNEYEVARTMEDSLKEIKNLQAHEELDKKYQTKMKDRTISEQKERERLNNRIMIGLGSVLLVIVFFLWRTISQRRRLNHQNIEIEKNLEEKQVLLKEIHHRVKNNFQIVSSLLEMQTRGIEDEQALELAKEGQNRIKSMAIIHQKLYQNDDLLIEFNDYVERLVGEIQNTFASRKMEAKIEVQPELVLDIDTAIPLGLVLNELITNAFKYGFDGEKEENNLLVRIEKGMNNYSMIVADTGGGISDEVDLKTTKSIGLYLVRRLSKQLGGSMSYSYKDGSEFVISFKDTAMRMA